MTKINQIQSAILSLGPGAYQKLMDAYLVKKYEFNNITTYGSHDGTDKTTSGTPDSFVRCDDGSFILMAYGTVGNNAFAKIEGDILACLDEKKTGIQTGNIKRIIACHTSTNLSPGQVKQLYSHFPDTVLVGLSDLAYDLLYKYPGIAKEYLSVDIDTHQILDVVDFVSVSSRNQYATSLDMPMLCRDKEQSELLALIEEKLMVLVFGKSGVGKTRLVLEVAKEFAERNNYILKIIRTNQESIYNDLMTTFTDDADYIVVVDDADQLVQLEHLFEISIDSTRRHKVKVVMTVRDYAKEKLIHKVKVSCQPGLYELTPMSDESIGQVLSENLGITNEELKKHIQLIAKGNIRLAIMAGSCAVTGDFSKIKNTFDIFENYYSSIIETLDKHELLVAGLVAFFDSFQLQENELPLVMAQEMSGIPPEEFKDICHTLHEKEVVSIFENQAIKFENQNLRDYLLYLVFYKEKWLSPSYMILSAFPLYRKRIVFAFNTLLQLFDTQDNREYLVMEIKKAWAKIKSGNQNTAFEFVEVFHMLIPDDTLLMVKRKIERLPEVHEDFIAFDFERTSNYHRINSKLIQLLIQFKDSDRFVDAIQLSLFYLERNTEKPMDFYFLFGEEWGFNYYSYKNGFDKERILIEQLTEYYTNVGTIEAARCLCFAISYCLKFRFSSTESNRNDSVTIYQFSLPACAELLEVRTQCIKALAILWVHPEHQKYAASIIKKYPEGMEAKDDKKIFENDLDALNTYLLEYLNPAIFTHCLLFKHAVRMCEFYHLLVPNWIEKFGKNNIYRLYQEITKDYLLETDNIDDTETERKNHIAEIFRKIEIEEFEDLLIELVGLEHEKKMHEEWLIGTGIDIIFSSIVEDRERFLNCARTYLSHDTPFGLYCQSLASGLISILGYRSAVDFISENSGKKCERWLTRLFNLIPGNEITTEDTDLFIERISEPPIETAAERVIELPLVMKIDSIWPGYAIKYITALNSISERYPYIMSSFLARIDSRDDGEVKDFVRRFCSNISALERAYITAERGQRYFDYHGSLFVELISENSGFLSSYVLTVVRDERLNLDEAHLEVLWDQDNFRELIKIVMAVLKEIYKSTYCWNVSGEKLLAHKAGQPEHWKRQDSWVRDYITCNCGDKSCMEFIFGILCNCSQEQLENAVVYFCEKNKSITIFRCLQLLPSHSSWSGSEVPVIQKRITLLEKIKSLLIGLDYVEHRAFLDERVQALLERKEDVLVKEFIEDR